MLENMLLVLRLASTSPMDLGVDEEEEHIDDEVGVDAEE